MGVALLLAGLAPLEPPRRREDGVDLDEVGDLVGQLTAAGINHLDVMEAAREPGRFAATARECLGAQEPEVQTYVRELAREEEQIAELARESLLTMHEAQQLLARCMGDLARARGCVSWGQANGRSPFDTFALQPDGAGNITQAEADRQVAEHLAQQRKASASLEVIGGDQRVLESLGLETEFSRMQRLAFSGPVDRAMVGKTGPIDFARVGELNRPPSYSEAPKPHRPAKSPESRADQRQRKAARSAAKKRRGWA